MSAKRQLLQALKSAEATVEALKQALQLLEWDESDESGNAATDATVDALEEGDAPEEGDGDAPEEGDGDAPEEGEAAPEAAQEGTAVLSADSSPDADDERATSQLLQLIKRRRLEEVD